ncbi:MAG TPA: hydrogenase maturation protease, partial [Anaerolineales bacterium]|nr:hydrogenase maturation protease [Anaerolineales bacterium]
SGGPRPLVTVLLAGIGHSLRGDDAAGLEAVQTWQRAYPDSASDPRIRIELLESPGIDLAHLLQDTEAGVLVDAVLSGGTPGEIHRFSELDISHFSAAGESVHGWGIPQALRMAKALGWSTSTGKLTVIGIEALQSEMGAPLSPAVQNALPAAAAAIQAEIRSFLGS